MQLHTILKILGESVSSALASKVVILDGIGKVSDFLDKLISFGDVLAGVRFH